MWLGTEDLELFRGDQRTMSFRFDAIARVQLISPEELKIIWFQQDAAAADNRAAAESISVPGQVMEMDEFLPETSLSSPDWQTEERQLDSELDCPSSLGRPQELRIQHCGSGPSAVRMAGEISDRVLFARHIEHKSRYLAVSRKGADPDPARRLRLATHLEKMTGMTEVERVKAAVEQILGGEREEDELLITRQLTGFLTRFRRNAYALLYHNNSCEQM